MQFYLESLANNCRFFILKFRKGNETMSTYDLAEIWVRFTEKIKESVSEKVFEIWINPIIPLEVTDNYYKVGVKNNFFKKIRIRS